MLIHKKKSNLLMVRIKEHLRTDVLRRQLSYQKRRGTQFRMNDLRPQGANIEQVGINSNELNLSSHSHLNFGAIRIIAKK